MTTTLRPPQAPPAQGKTTEKTPWWRRPWIVPLVFIALSFIAVSVPRYLTFDPANSFITDPPEWFPAFYGFLVTHVLFGTVAMTTCCMQIWPWLRQKHPKVHRISGRIYVFGGVLPAGVTAAVIAAVSPFGPVEGISSFMMSLLWMAMTIAGFRMARQRRFAVHRRWMVRSFALTMSIILNRFFAVPITLIMLNYRDTVFHGDATLVTYVSAGMSGFLGWTICLLIAEWWLVERGGRPGSRGRAGPSRITTAPPAS